MTLSKEFIGEQKKKLLEEKSRLESELKTIARPSSTNPQDFKAIYEDVGSDQDDNVLEVYTYEQHLAIENDLENMLGKVNAALQKMEKGNYGKCDQGEDIEIERLKVIPWATTCIKHSK